MADTVTADAVEILRDVVEHDREDALTEALGLAKRARTDPAADARLELALSRVDQLDRRLKAIPDVKVVRERPVYGPGAQHQFFGDLVAAAVPNSSADAVQAQDRLARHAESERGRRESESRSARAALAYQGFRTNDVAETRALSMTAGAAGEFSSPRWMDELFASVARTASPLSRMVTSLDLPDGCDAVSVPRFTVFAGLSSEGDDDQNVNVGDEYSASDLLTGHVISIEGGAYISQQWVDRVPVSDQILSHDFGDAYSASLEALLFTGSGTGNQPLGLLNLPATTDSVPGVNAVTYTNASPTPVGVVNAVAQGIAQVSNNRERMPNAALMRGARLAWLLGTVDGSTDEPTSRPGTGNIPDDPDTGAYGPIAGLPAYVANAIPSDLGSGANQDAVVVCRTKDIVLLEDPSVHFTVFPAGGTAGQLTCWVGFHRYIAVIANKYPSGTAIVTGTGLVVQSGF